MGKRLIVTGYGGFVAGSVIWQARHAWELHALSRSLPARQRPGFRSYQFDICDAPRMAALFDEAMPDAVIHTAALADIDFCQAHREEAERVNVGGTRVLARLCAERGVKLVFCSTDSVFDGIRGMYTEADQPAAVNWYAETKIRGEELVRDGVASGVVARLALVVGLPVLGAGNSFLTKMIGSLAAGQSVRFPANEIRTPLDVITAGRALLELAASDFAGVLHLAGNTRVDRYEMACQLAQRLGYDRRLVAATDSNAMPGRAPRPNDASLENARARRLLRTPMRTLMEGLATVLEAKEAQEHEQSADQA